LVSENVVLHGWGGSVQNPVQLAYNLLGGKNFQSVYSVMFTRMLGIDVFWVHLWLVPVLWGVFVSAVAFLVVRALGMGERTSIVSALLVSVFPLLVFWGTISVANSVGYIFFWCSLFFYVRYLSSNELKVKVLAVAFTLAAFLAHYLTGFMAVAFFVLAVAFKRYEGERKIAAFETRVLLLVAFVFSVSLLPLVLTYVGYFSSSFAYFSLDKISGLSGVEVVGLFLFGDYFDYAPSAALLNVLGPLIGFFGLVYLLFAGAKRGSNSVKRVLVGFFLVGYLVVFVDYRVLKLFMVGVPFAESRVWVFRDLLLLPFVAFVVDLVVRFFRRRVSKPLFQRVFTVFVVFLLSVWIVASVFSVYSTVGPLQTTSYELDAVKFIDRTTNQSYVVVGDQWILLAGGMIVGVYNPRAFYFPYSDVRGSQLFNSMLSNASPSVLVEAMAYNNSSLAYFIVEEPRLGASEFSRVVSLSLSNGLTVYSEFGGGQLVVFRYEVG
jgi:hypothetical protein